MTTLETLKEELSKVQQAQADCVSEEGYILNHKKWAYKSLVKTANDLKGAIEWMEQLYSGV